LDLKTKLGTYLEEGRLRVEAARGFVVVPSPESVSGARRNLVRIEGGCVGDDGEAESEVFSVLEKRGRRLE